MKKQRKKRRKGLVQTRLDRAGTLVHLAVQLGLLALLVALPLGRGGRDPWAVTGGLVWLGCLIVLWLVSGALQGRLDIYPSRIYWIALAFLGVIGLQLVPLGSTVLGLQPETVARWDMARTAGLTDLGTSISLAPGGTWQALQKVVLVLGAGFLMINVFCRRQWILRLVIGLLAMAGVQALVGFWPAVMSTRNWHWYLGIAEHVVHGTFPNRNQFSCMMGIGLIFCLGVLFLILYARKHEHRQLFNPGETPWLPSSVPVLIAIPALMFIMASAQVLSLSRGGALSTAVGLAFLGLYGLIRLRQRWQGAAWAVGAGAVLLGGSSEGLDRLSNRYEQLIGVGNLGMIGRIAIWKDCLGMLKDHWLLGSGLGSFEVVSPKTETGFAGELISLHAHNDWLELVLELGVPIGLFFIAVVVYFLISSWRRILGRRDALAKWLGLAAMTSLSVVALHACVEYNLHIPGTALAITAVVVVAIICCRLPGKASAAAETASLCRLSLSPAVRVVLGVAAVAAGVAGCIAGYPHIRVGRLESKLDMLVSKGVRESTRMKPVPHSTYCLQLAESILAVQPANDVALWQRAEHGTFLLRHDLERAIADGRMAAFTPELLNRLDSYAENMVTACRAYPTRGDYQAVAAAAVEQAAVFAGTLSEEPVRRMFETAHANYPNLSKVSFLSANAAWRRYGRRQAGGHDTQEARAEALALYREAIRQNPARAGRVYARIWQRDPDPAVLETVTPTFLVAHEKLYSFYNDHGVFDACLKTLDRLTTLNATRKTVADVDELSAYDMGRISRQSREDVTASIARRQAFVLGMLGRWKEREAIIANEEALLALGLTARMARATALADGGQFDRAEGAYKRILARAPGYDDAVLAYSRLLRQRGQYHACLKLLLTLLYRPEITHDPDTLAAALVLAGQCDIPGDEADGRFPLKRFVQAGLHFWLNPDSGDPELLTPVLTELLALKAVVMDATSPGWLQTPMLLYYLGRCQELCVSRDRAITTYREILGICPGHWTSIQRLRELGAAVPAATEALTARVSASVPLKANFGGRVMVLGYDLDATAITREQAVTLRYYVLCIGDIDRDYQFRMAFRNRGTVYFNESIDPGNDYGQEMLGWRVGELIVLERTLNPAQSAARYRHHLAAGRYDVEVSIAVFGRTPEHLQPIIPARAPAFRIEETP